MLSHLTFLIFHFLIIILFPFFPLSSYSFLYSIISYHPYSSSAICSNLSVSSSGDLYHALKKIKLTSADTFDLCDHMLFCILFHTVSNCSLSYHQFLYPKICFLLLRSILLLFSYQKLEILPHYVFLSYFFFSFLF